MTLSPHCVLRRPTTDSWRTLVLDLSDGDNFRVIYVIAFPYLKPELDYDLLPSLLLDSFHSSPRTRFILIKVAIFRPPTLNTTLSEYILFGVTLSRCETLMKPVMKQDRPVIPLSGLFGRSWVVLLQCPSFFSRVYLVKWEI